jgi:hypothetical protein
MAKRAPAHETPYSPLDMTLAQSVVKGARTGQHQGASPSEGLRVSPIQSPSQDEQAAFDGHAVGLPGHVNHVALPKKSAMRNLNREKRVLLTEEEEREVERLVDRIGEQLGSSLKLSHLLRACMAILCHAEEELLRHSAELHSLPRPSNGDAVALAQFELTLAKMLSRSLRDAPLIR